MILKKEEAAQTRIQAASVIERRGTLETTLTFLLGRKSFSKNKPCPPIDGRIAFKGQPLRKEIFPPNSTIRMDLDAYHMSLKCSIRAIKFIPAPNAFNDARMGELRLIIHMQTATDKAIAPKSTNIFCLVFIKYHPSLDIHSHKPMNPQTRPHINSTHPIHIRKNARSPRSPPINVCASFTRTWR